MKVAMTVVSLQHSCTDPSMYMYMCYYYLYMHCTSQKIHCWLHNQRSTSQHIGYIYNTEVYGNDTCTHSYVHCIHSRLYVTNLCCSSSSESLVSPPSTLNKSIPGALDQQWVVDFIASVCWRTIKSMDWSSPQMAARILATKSGKLALIQSRFSIPTVMSWRKVIYVSNYMYQSYMY